MEPRKRLTFTDQVRSAVRESGLTAQEIADGAKIHKSAMSRFLSGERGLSEDAFDRLAAILGLRVVAGKSARRSRR